MNQTPITNRRILITYRSSILILFCILDLVIILTMARIITYLDTFYYLDPFAISSHKYRFFENVLFLLFTGFSCLTLWGIWGAPFFLLFWILGKKNIWISLLLKISLLSLLIGIPAFWQMVHQYQGTEYEQRIRTAILRAKDKSSQLTSALEAYQDDHGRYPQFLELLQPEYLLSIPHTGLAGAREFEYGRHNHNSYSIWVYHRILGMPRGEIQYNSNHDYSRYPQQKIIMVDDWVYIRY